jgi:hypothetical protein
MKAAICSLVVLAVASFAPHSIAADAFPGKPKISMAYGQLSRAVLNLEKFKPGEPRDQVKKVVEFLDVARLNLDQAAKNKGSAPGGGDQADRQDQGNSRQSKLGPGEDR